ncbi:MAG: DUF4386 domain-containing protein [Sediminibacterium sp.]
MKTTFQSNKRTARLAGFLFICVCIPLSFWGESYVWSVVFVPRDPVATANRLLSNETIFRASIVSHIIGTFSFGFMVMLLFRLFRPVDKHLSRLMLVPVLAMIPIVFVLETLNFAALMILKGETRSTFAVTQQHEISYFLLRLQSYGFSGTKFFFGLCFIPFGMLVFRSRFLPRIFGFLLLVSGFAYIIDSLTYILLQRSDYLMVHKIVSYTSAGYVLTFLWLLIKSVRNPTNQAIS